MAKKSNIAVKLVVLVLVAGAIYFVLDSFLSGRRTADTATPADTAGASLTREQAEALGREIGTRIGREIGTQIGRDTAMQMLAERGLAPPNEVVASTDAAASAEPPPSAEPAVQETTPASAPAPAAEPAPASALEPTTSPEPAAPEPAQPAPAPVAAETESPTWWDRSLSSEPGALVLRYAGELKAADGSARGIALLFEGRFDTAEQAASHIQVSGGNGAVGGSWEVGKNPAMLILRDVKPGRYRIRISAGLSDADGKSLKTDLGGRIRVSGN